MKVLASLNCVRINKGCGEIKLEGNVLKAIAFVVYLDVERIPR
jgi:hypothetical protein